MPAIGEKNYSNHTNTFIDDARNYKRKSIDEHDDCSFVEDLFYLNKERKDVQKVHNENLFVNVELGSTRTNAIGLNLVKNNNSEENKIKESSDFKNYQHYGKLNELSLESPLNEIQRYQLTLLKKNNPSCPKVPKSISTNDNIDNCVKKKSIPEESELETDNNQGKIDISMKENTHYLNNSNQGKIQERHLLIKPRRNYNDLHSIQMDDSTVNNQNVHTLNENAHEEKNTLVNKSSHFLNSYEIPVIHEMKKSDKNVHSKNTLQYENKNSSTKNNGFTNKVVNNNYDLKYIMPKWHNEIIMCEKSNNQKTEKTSKVKDNLLDDYGFKKGSFVGMDNLFENSNFTIQKRESNVKEKNTINHPTSEYLEKKKVDIRDTCDTFDTSKTSTKSDDHCVIYKRERHENQKINAELTKSKEIHTSQFSQKGINYRNSRMDEDISPLRNSVTTSNRITITSASGTANCRNEIKIKQSNEQPPHMNSNNLNRKNNQFDTNMVNFHKHEDGKENIGVLCKDKTIVPNLKVKDKLNPHEKEIKGISRNTTPNKNMNKSIPKCLNVSSKIKNEKSVTYLTYDDITDFEYELNVDNINDIINNLIEITKDQEWTKQIENLINLRKILKFHHKLFFDNHVKELRKISRSIIELLNSPRSCVSKNALLCLSEFYSIGRKRMDCTLDDVILPCLKKAHQTSTDFLSNAANNALLSICNSCTESKLILHFVKIITSKQKTYNLICLKCLIAVIIKFEENIFKFKEINKLVEALFECTTGGSAEMKCTARVALVVLDNICPIKKIGNKFHIPADKIKKIEGLTDRTSESEIDSVLGKIKFSE
ncbi:hypothetical protein, conserved [Plasmodium gonderi]|uniref:CLASP N-terminal domain-containing protein n=1 Tax=Plasmodium gonderi TaxID=77519 RepID=A0A1Y1JJB5_PLAGO|nr:hypothetical protein, conserved [Plasmodium gonderi]GAW82596.1 hypothetical protein, conserved [Plasmodium gonderi]